jgi:hypothetical protein
MTKLKRSESADDITAQKGYNDYLKKYSDKKNSILNILSHDLAGPLGMIHNLSTLLEEDAKSSGRGQSGLRARKTKELPLRSPDNRKNRRNIKLAVNFSVRTPMTGLLDHIFHNLEERNLGRSQIVDYIGYLDELILGGLLLDKELEYQAIKLRLVKRLNELNRDQIKFYPGNKEDKES